MPNIKHKLGFCPSCMKNVPHARGFSLSLLRTLDRLSLRSLRFFRIGPWHCVQCDKKSFCLRLQRSSAPRIQLQNNRRRSRDRDELPDADSSGCSIEPVLRLNGSSTRLKRFSQKYRDSIVRQITSGKTTFSQIRNEKGLKETELVDWIADLIDRMQNEIHESRSAFAPRKHLAFDSQFVEEFEVGVDSYLDQPVASTDDTVRIDSPRPK